MKISRVAFLAAALPVFLLLPGGEVAAQVELGVHGSLADVRDAAPGIGGRIALLRAARNGRADVGIEAGGTYYFPSCNGVQECSAWGASAVLMGRQETGGRTRSFAGVGAKYVDVSATSGGTSTSGDAWGFLVLLGAEYGYDSAVSPFFEFGWSFMDAGPDIWEFSLGLRFDPSR